MCLTSNVPKGRLREGLPLGRVGRPLGPRRGGSRGVQGGKVKPLWGAEGWTDRMRSHSTNPLSWSPPYSGLAAYSTSVNLGPDGQVLGKHDLVWWEDPKSAASEVPKSPRKQPLYLTSSFLPPVGKGAGSNCSALLERILLTKSTSSHFTLSSASSS